MELPSDLNIPEPDFNKPLDIVKELAIGPTEAARGEGPKTRSTKPAEALQAACAEETLAIVINAWKIKSRMTDALSKELKEELAKDDVKKISRYLESIFDSFARLGIEIIDRTGECFDYGLPEKVVTAKPQDGICKELVLETLRPTIKWNNQIYPAKWKSPPPLQKTINENYEPHHH